MSYQEIYKSKVITVDDALKLVKNDYNIGFSSGVDGPISIERRFHEVSKWCRNIRILTSSSAEAYPFLLEPEYQNTFRTDVIFSSPYDREAYARGTASFVPSHLNNAAVDWVKNFPLDIFYGVCSPMDEHGYIHLAPCLMQEYACMQSAKTLVLECNPNIPVVYGATTFRMEDIDYFVETSTELGVAPTPKKDPAFDTMGCYIADLIHDGDCIQLGIGSLPDAVAINLINKHDLGIHTEMITSTMATLCEAGVVTGKKKTLYPGKMIGAFSVGDKHTYKFLDHNTSVEFLPMHYVVDPATISKNDNMVSINTCFSCDLTGQVSSEAIGTHMYSGTGGQASTAIGAVRSRGGRSIIAMRSTTHTKNGVVSNINAIHPAGTVISLHRNDVDYVVTEYGVAHLRGLSIRDRIDQLIPIAHPDYRAELRKDAERLHLKYY